MADATVKIPAEHAEAFYREAIDTLLYAASNVAEGARWFARARAKMIGSRRRIFLA